MHVDVRFRSLRLSPALRDHALRRVRAHLGRFEGALRAVVVRLADDNGPRGGVDKRCQVTVLGPRVRGATVVERGGDPYAAVDLAVSRIALCVARALGRGRGQRARRGPALRRRWALAAGE